MSMQVEGPRELTRENLTITRTIEDTIANSTVANVITLPKNAVVVIPTSATVREAIDVCKLDDPIFRSPQASEF